MCNDHDHHVSYSSKDCDNMCFRHSVIEAIGGAFVEVEVTTYEPRECDKCKRERGEAVDG